MPRTIDPVPALGAIRSALLHTFPISGQGHVLALGHTQSLGVALARKHGMRSAAPRKSLRMAGSSVWLSLVHRSPDRAPYDGSIELLPKAALKHPDRARMLVMGWIAAVRDVLRHGVPSAVERLAIAHLEDRKTLRRTDLRSQADVVRALLTTGHLGRFMPLPDVRDAKGRSAAEAGLALLSELLPITGGDVSLELAGPWDAETPSVGAHGAGIFAVLRLFVWEPSSPPRRAIRDVREQYVYLAPTAALHDPDRLEQYLRGWAQALAIVFGSAPINQIETCMPHEFVDPSVFALRRAHTAEDFAQALLRPSRLGKMMAGAAGPRE